MYKLTEHEKGVVNVVEIAIDWCLSIPDELLQEYNSIIERLNMNKFECSDFSCKLRASCLYFGSCEKCKIHPCDICVIQKTCRKVKEK